MFVGENFKKEPINLLHYTKNEIEEMRKEDWFCPSCQKRLIIKNGKVMVSHFAHSFKTSCFAFSEGETEEHLKGKQLLASWCEENKIAYQVEAYLPKLAQRPDVLINQNIALEFQCSPLSLQKLIERTEQYHKNGYEVIWILGKSFFLKEQLSVLQRAFLSYHSNLGFYLWQLDVINQKLSLRYHIEKGWFKGELYSGVKEWKVGAVSIIKVLSYPQASQLFHKRKHLVATKVENTIYHIEELLWRKDKRIMPLQAYCYQKRINLRLLDIVYYLPVTVSLAIQDNELLWRLYFWAFLEEQKECEIKEIVNYFKEQIKLKKLKLYDMPLIANHDLIRLFVKNYVVVLLKLGYIKLQNKKILLIKKTICYKSSEERDADFKVKLKSIKQISATPQGNMLS